MAKEYKDLVVGLDIGTSKVMVVVAEVLPSGELKLAGLGVAPSNGIKRGVVVNIDATVQSIQQALRMAGNLFGGAIDRTGQDGDFHEQLRNIEKSPGIMPQVDSPPGCFRMQRLALGYRT